MADSQKSTFKLSLSGEVYEPIKSEIYKIQQDHKRAFFLKNAVWFCQVRWIVVLIFAIYGLCGLIPGLFDMLRLRGNVYWPFIIAGILAVANTIFFLHIKSLKTKTITGSIETQLWSQIIFDLFAITILMQKTGCIETYIPFFYLLHIIIACILFSRMKSFLVTFFCIVLYIFCVVLEMSGKLPGVSFYSNSGLRDILKDSLNIVLMNVITSIFIWVIVWFLISQISTMLRDREKTVRETNIRLEKSQEERMDHMMRTTHELKAPFAAIHANTQLLLEGYCGPLPEKALDVMNKISYRCRRLTNEIKLMLQLANLRSATETHDMKEMLDLADVLNYCINQVSQIAVEYNITLNNTCNKVMVSGVEDHLKMLFINILSNAIYYSYKGGDVNIKCRKTPEGNPCITVEDKGIGIPGEKLHNIFNEYYRTKEAANHNKNSTGLGLAIVKHVAITHNIRIIVESLVNSGTKFILIFPR